MRPIGFLMFGTLSRLRRLLGAAFVLARHDALLPREYQDRLPGGARLFGRVLRLFAVRGRGQDPGARLARAFEALGPTYVKLGQFLSTRGDIIGPRFAEGLATLKDRAAPFPRKRALAAIEAEFARPWAEVFTEISEPIAAASLAQVHRARGPDGADVAIKVLRPRIEERVAADLDALRLGANLMERMAPASRRLEPLKFVDTVARAAQIELDLRLEAASASELAEIAVEVDGYTVADVDWALSGQRVLTTEWVDGVRLSDDAGLEAAGLDRHALAAIVIRSFLHCALEHGVFHADVHEGNLFARLDGSLTAVDFGIVGRIGPDERRYLAEILFGFLRRDYRRIAEVHFEAGYVPAHHSVDDFALALRSVGEPIFGKRAADVSMGRLLLQLFEVTDLFDMKLRPELVLLQKTMVQAEGVARRLDPNFDMWAASRPVVERWMRRQLGPEGFVRETATNLGRLRETLNRLPDAIEDLRAAADAAASGGIRLDDDTVTRLAAVQARSGRGRTAALWLLAVAAAGLAAAAGVAVLRP